MMSPDLVLKPACNRCGSTTDLYGSNCKHMTLCTTCGKSMAENHAKCFECGAVLTRLIREYPVRASSSSDKNYFIGRFLSGLPSFSKKKNAENKWSLQKEALQGRQVTDSLREKFKNKPWLLEDETGQFQYQGQLEGAQSATYYLLQLQGKEFNAIPAGSWYNFNKVAQYKQLTLEEAEEKIKNRRKTADGYERWMMKAAKDGASAFSEGFKFHDSESGSAGGGKGRKKTGGEDDEGNASDKGEEDEDDESARRSRLGLNKKGGDDDEEEGNKGDEYDLDDEIEKGDDWEHEEIFTDDDEAVGIDPEEREDLAPEVPAPPEIKDDDEEDEENEEEGGLSKSGKELKKLLGRNAEKNESEDDDDDDEDLEDDNLSPILAPKKKDAPKEEPLDNSPEKSGPSGSSKSTPPSKLSKGKRKLNGDDVKPAINGAQVKKVKTENGQDTKPSSKEGNGSSKSSSAAKGTPSSSQPGTTSPSAGPVTEDEIRAVLLQRPPVTTQDLVAKFKVRLKCQEEKAAFADILKRISKIQKTNGPNYIVLRET